MNESRARRRRLLIAGAAVVAMTALAGCADDAGPSAAGSTDRVTTPAPQTSTRPAPSTFHESPAASSARHTKAPKAQKRSTAAARPTASATKKPRAGHGTGLTVTAALGQIPTKGRAPKTGYDRDEFGNGWKDPDRNGCDTRNDVLDRDLSSTTYRPGTQGCVVLTGVLNDPYTGTRIRFQRGQSTSTRVQIDHVVALSDAWQTGAQKLSAETRLRLANDPMNLLAVDGPTNASKSDGDAATWLPPAKGYRCDYVARQTAVKLKYGLWMTSAEKSAIQRIISRCPDQRVPSK